MNKMERTYQSRPGVSHCLLTGLLALALLAGGIGQIFLFSRAAQADSTPHGAYSANFTYKAE
jgi:hypothetical protein